MMKEIRQQKHQRRVFGEDLGGRGCLGTPDLGSTSFAGVFADLRELRCAGVAGVPGLFLVGIS